MLSAYMLAFCRMVMGIMFAWSFVGKVREGRAFEQTITRFEVLPERWSRLVAGLVLGGELAVVIAMIIGGPFLAWGFLMGAGMLIVFCCALASVLARGLQTSCGCFGSTDKAVSSMDIVRNLGFVVCAVGGYSTSTITQNSLTVSDTLEWGLVGLAGLLAMMFVAVWTQVGEINHLFR